MQRIDRLYSTRFDSDTSAQSCSYTTSIIYVFKHRVFVRTIILGNCIGAAYFYSSSNFSLEVVPIWDTCCPMTTSVYIVQSRELQ